MLQIAVTNEHAVCKNNDGYKYQPLTLFTQRYSNIENETLGTFANRVTGFVITTSQKKIPKWGNHPLCKVAVTCLRITSSNSKGKLPPVVGMCVLECFLQPMFSNVSISPLEACNIARHFAPHTVSRLCSKPSVRNLFVIVNRDFLIKMSALPMAELREIVFGHHRSSARGVCSWCFRQGSKYAWCWSSKNF